MSAGYVYVLSNPCMPGIVKIGRSAHGGQSRADSMYKSNTSVPEPFYVEFEAMFVDCVAAERAIHNKMANCRINPAREFFRIDAESAAYWVVEALRKQGAYTVDDYGPAAADVQPGIVNAGRPQDVSLSWSEFVDRLNSLGLLSIEASYAADKCQVAYFGRDDRAIELVADSQHFTGDELIDLQDRLSRAATGFCGLEYTVTIRLVGGAEA